MGGGRGKNKKGELRKGERWGNGEIGEQYLKILFDMSLWFGPYNSHFDSFLGIDWRLYSVINNFDL